MSNEELIKRAENAIRLNNDTKNNYHHYYIALIAELTKALKQAETTHTRILDCR